MQTGVNFPVILVRQRAEITWPELLQASAQPSFRPTTATRFSDTRPGGNGSRPSTLLLKLSEFLYGTQFQAFDFACSSYVYVSFLQHDHQ